ncbi:KpsF/GutQ family sugar-phosphate isomerase [Agriterribacter sp.]|uniref:KpsF/GutQ family sugar-phosphate isomerase n=1 Tax=Agriterribacter sp. TaxID=2821509 RepID=UPI002BCD030D|nr:KpsF/GutQ family sugar-phosphate isomerase [Agriterribacter sp.]HTN06064.1 KpsF/GutQ family sugar-phosphate isomerase [Agriterribacter sp.]
MRATDIQAIARRTILLESESVKQLAGFIDVQFEAIVKLIAGCKGKIVISGIGKSALIAQKIVATFNSTGTQASFLHAADAIHGDLGMVQQNDIILIISKSGESPEIKLLLPLVKNFGNPVIAMTGNLDSYLSANADYILNTTVEQEACPNNLAPTTSTMAQLAMGDALAVCLMEYKGFTSDDFAKFHPGGMLGKRLYLKVSDLFMKDARPQVDKSSNLKEVIVAITQNRMGATAVIQEGVIAGIVTDGDLRRMLQKEEHLSGITAEDIMSKNPKCIEEEALAVSALDMMRKNNVSQLLVTRNGLYAGVLHLHDLIREGII